MKLNLREKLNLGSSKRIHQLTVGNVLDQKQLDTLKYNIEDNILLFLSLSCRHCLDLLPKLNQMPNNFLMYIDQEFEVAQEIRKHFNFSFPIIHITQEEYYQLGVTNTPSVAIIQNKEIIFIDESIDETFFLNKIRQYGLKL